MNPIDCMAWMKKRYFIIILLIAAFVAGSFFWLKKPSYELVSAKMGPMIETVYGLGKVKTHRKYDVKVGVITYVKRIYVKEGQEVKEGAPLILFSETRIFRAPFDGTVTDIVYHESDSVVPQSTVLTMLDLNHMFIEVSLEQEGALRVRKGQAAKVLFESIKGELLPGKVVAIFPKHDEFLVHIEVEGLGENVLPGMTADVSIVVSSNKEVLLVPMQALTNGFLLVQRESQELVKVPVKIGGIDGEWAEVLDGDVRAGDQIVVNIKKRFGL